MKPFTLFELGQQDFARGEPPGPGYGSDCQRVAGWDAAYRDSLAKAAGGMRRINAGRYETEDGHWSIVETGRGRWSLLKGFAPSLRGQTELMAYPTFAEAMAGLRQESFAATHV